jgi:hypothetical protein
MFMSATHSLATRTGTNARKGRGVRVLGRAPREFSVHLKGLRWMSTGAAPFSVRRVSRVDRTPTVRKDPSPRTLVSRGDARRMQTVIAARAFGVTVWRACTHACPDERSARRALRAHAPRRSGRAESSDDDTTSSPLGTLTDLEGRRRPLRLRHAPRPAEPSSARRPRRTLRPPSPASGSRDLRATDPLATAVLRREPASWGACEVSAFYAIHGDRFLCRRRTR